MTRVTLIGVSKRFGKTVAADDVSLEIGSGELFTFLGPSGCGKTTTLRIIAGFETPDKGQVLFDDRDVTFTRPQDRGCAMVFQNYALWPHMTVWDNIAYGLKLRRLPAEEIRRRVSEVVRMVGLEGLENRYPLQLSGGQQQRVALARALVIEPKVLLLDEPLSNLDAKLRLRMREELKRLQRNLGITTVYVTHDQEEAMSISDRIAVMSQGRVLQVGTPSQIYSDPANFFVASFIGRSVILRGTARLINESEALFTTTRGVTLRAVPKERISDGERVVAVIRPEDFSPDSSGGDNRLEGMVEMVMFLGTFKQVRVNVNGEVFSAYLDPDLSVEVGSRLTLYLDKTSVLLYRAPAELEHE